MMTPRVSMQAIFQQSPNSKCIESLPGQQLAQWNLTINIELSENRLKKMLDFQTHDILRVSLHENPWIFRPVGRHQRKMAGAWPARRYGTLAHATKEQGACGWPWESKGSHLIKVNRSWWLLRGMALRYPSWCDAIQLMVRWWETYPRCAESMEYLPRLGEKWLHEQGMQQRG